MSSKAEESNCSTLSKKTTTSTTTSSGNNYQSSNAEVHSTGNKNRRDDNDAHEDEVVKTACPLNGSSSSRGDSRTKKEERRPFSDQEGEIGPHTVYNAPVDASRKWKSKFCTSSAPKSGVEALPVEGRTAPGMSDASSHGLDVSSASSRTLGDSSSLVKREDEKSMNHAEDRPARVEAPPFGSSGFTSYPTQWGYPRAKALRAKERRGGRGSAQFTSSSSAMETRKHQSPVVSSAPSSPHSSVSYSQPSPKYVSRSHTAASAENTPQLSTPTYPTPLSQEHSSQHRGPAYLPVDPPPSFHLSLSRPHSSGNFPSRGGRGGGDSEGVPPLPPPPPYTKYNVSSSHHSHRSFAATSSSSSAPPVHTTALTDEKVRYPSDADRSGASQSTQLEVYGGAPVPPRNSSTTKYAASSSLAPSYSAQESSSVAPTFLSSSPRFSSAGEREMLATIATSSTSHPTGGGSSASTDNSKSRSGPSKKRTSSGGGDEEEAPFIHTVSYYDNMGTPPAHFPPTSLRPPSSSFHGISLASSSQRSGPSHVPDAFRKHKYFVTPSSPPQTPQQSPPGPPQTHGAGSAQPSSSTSSSALSSSVYPPAIPPSQPMSLLHAHHLTSHPTSFLSGLPSSSHPPASAPANTSPSDASSGLHFAHPHSPPSSMASSSSQGVSSYPAPPPPFQSSQGERPSHSHRGGTPGSEKRPPPPPPKGTAPDTSSSPSPFPYATEANTGEVPVHRLTPTTTSSPPSVHITSALPYLANAPSSAPSSSSTPIGPSTASSRIRSPPIYPEGGEKSGPYARGVYEAGGGPSRTTHANASASFPSFSHSIPLPPPPPPPPPPSSSSSISPPQPHRPSATGTHAPPQPPPIRAPSLEERSKKMTQDSRHSRGTVSYSSHSQSPLAIPPYSRDESTETSEKSKSDGEDTAASLSTGRRRGGGRGKRAHHPPRASHTDALSASPGSSRGGDRIGGSRSPLGNGENESPLTTSSHPSSSFSVLHSTSEVHSGEHSRTTTTTTPTVVTEEEEPTTAVPATTAVTTTVTFAEVEEDPSHRTDRSSVEVGTNTVVSPEFLPHVTDASGVPKEREDYNKRRRKRRELRRLRGLEKDGAEIPNDMVPRVAPIRILNSDGTRRKNRYRSAFSSSRSPLLAAASLSIPQSDGTEDVIPPSLSLLYPSDASPTDVPSPSAPTPTDSLKAVSGGIEVPHEDSSAPGAALPVCVPPSTTATTTTAAEEKGEPLSSPSYSASSCPAGSKAPQAVPPYAFRTSKYGRGRRIKWRGSSGVGEAHHEPFPHPRLVSEAFSGSPLMPPMATPAYGKEPAMRSTPAHVPIPLPPANTVRYRIDHSENETDSGRSSRSGSSRYSAEEEQDTSLSEEVQNSYQQMVTFSSFRTPESAFTGDESYLSDRLPPFSATSSVELTDGTLPVRTRKLRRRRNKRQPGPSMRKKAASTSEAKKSKHTSPLGTPTITSAPSFPFHLPTSSSTMPHPTQGISALDMWPTYYPPLGGGGGGGRGTSSIYVSAPLTTQRGGSSPSGSYYLPTYSPYSNTHISQTNTQYNSAPMHQWNAQHPPPPPQQLPPAQQLPPPHPRSIALPTDFSHRSPWFSSSTHMPVSQHAAGPYQHEIRDHISSLQTRGIEYNGGGSPFFVPPSTSGAPSSSISPGSDASLLSYTRPSVSLPVHTVSSRPEGSTQPSFIPSVFHPPHVPPPVPDANRTFSSDDTSQTRTKMTKEGRRGSSMTFPSFSPSHEGSSSSGLPTAHSDDAPYGHLSLYYPPSQPQSHLPQNPYASSSLPYLPGSAAPYPSSAAPHLMASPFLNSFPSSVPPGALPFLSAALPPPSFSSGEASGEEPRESSFHAFPSPSASSSVPAPPLPIPAPFASHLNRFDVLLKPFVRSGTFGECGVRSRKPLQRLWAEGEPTLAHQRREAERMGVDKRGASSIPSSSIPRDRHTTATIPHEIRSPIPREPFSNDPPSPPPPLLRIGIDGNYFISQRLFHFLKLDPLWFLHSLCPEELLLQVGEFVQELRERNMEPVFVFQGVGANLDSSRVVSTVMSMPAAPHVFEIPLRVWCQLEKECLPFMEELHGKHGVECDGVSPLKVTEDIVLEVQRYLRNGIFPSLNRGDASSFSSSSSPTAHVRHLTTAGDVEEEEECERMTTSHPSPVTCITAPFLHWCQLVTLHVEKKVQLLMGPVDMLLLPYPPMQVITHLNFETEQASFIRRATVVQSLFPRLSAGGATFTGGKTDFSPPHLRASATQENTGPTSTMTQSTSGSSSSSTLGPNSTHHVPSGHMGGPSFHCSFNPPSFSSQAFLGDYLLMILGILRGRDPHVNILSLGFVPNYSINQLKDLLYQWGCAYDSARLEERVLQMIDSGDDRHLPDTSVGSGAAGAGVASSASPPMSGTAFPRSVSNSSPGVPMTGYAVGSTTKSPVNLSVATAEWMPHADASNPLSERGGGGGGARQVALPSARRILDGSGAVQEAGRSASAEATSTHWVGESGSPARAPRETSLSFATGQPGISSVLYAKTRDFVLFCTVFCVSSLSSVELRAVSDVIIAEHEPESPYMRVKKDGSTTVSSVVSLPLDSFYRVLLRHHIMPWVVPLTLPEGEERSGKDGHKWGGKLASRTSGNGLHFSSTGLPQYFSLYDVLGDLVPPTLLYLQMVGILAVPTMTAIVQSYFTTPRPVVDTIDYRQLLPMLKTFRLQSFCQLLESILSPVPLPVSLPPISSSPLSHDGEGNAASPPCPPLSAPSFLSRCSSPSAGGEEEKSRVRPTRTPAGGHASPRHSVPSSVHYSLSNGKSRACSRTLAWICWCTDRALMHTSPFGRIKLSEWDLKAMLRDPCHPFRDLRPRNERDGIGGTEERGRAAEKEQRKHSSAYTANGEKGGTHYVPTTTIPTASTSAGTGRQGTYRPPVPPSSSLGTSYSPPPSPPPPPLSLLDFANAHWDMDRLSCIVSPARLLSTQTKYCCIEIPFRRDDPQPSSALPTSLPFTFPSSNPEEAEKDSAKSRYIYNGRAETIVALHLRAFDFMGYFKHDSPEESELDAPNPKEDDDDDENEVEETAPRPRKRGDEKSGSFLQQAVTNVSAAPSPTMRENTVRKGQKEEDKTEMKNGEKTMHSSSFMLLPPFKELPVMHTMQNHASPTADNGIGSTTKREVPEEMTDDEDALSDCRANSAYVTSLFGESFSFQSLLSKSLSHSPNAFHSGLILCTELLRMHPPVLHATPYLFFPASSVRGPPRTHSWSQEELPLSMEQDHHFTDPSPRRVPRSTTLDAPPPQAPRQSSGAAAGGTVEHGGGYLNRGGGECPVCPPWRASAGGSTAPPISHAHLASVPAPAMSAPSTTALAPHHHPYGTSASHSAPRASDERFSTPAGPALNFPPLAAGADGRSQKEDGKQTAFAASASVGEPCGREVQSICTGSGDHTNVHAGEETVFPHHGKEIGGGRNPYPPASTVPPSTDPLLSSSDTSVRSDESVDFAWKDLHRDTPEVLLLSRIACLFSVPYSYRLPLLLPSLSLDETADHKGRIGLSSEGVFVPMKHPQEDDAKSSSHPPSSFLLSTGKDEMTMERKKVGELQRQTPLMMSSFNASAPSQSGGASGVERRKPCDDPTSWSAVDGVTATSVGAASTTHDYYFVSSFPGGSKEFLVSSDTTGNGLREDSSPVFPPYQHLPFNSLNDKEREMTKRNMAHYVSTVPIEKSTSTDEVDGKEVTQEEGATSTDLGTMERKKYALQGGFTRTDTLFMDRDMQRSGPIDSGIKKDSEDSQWSACKEASLFTPSPVFYRPFSWAPLYSPQLSAFFGMATTISRDMQEMAKCLLSSMVLKGLSSCTLNDVASFTKFDALPFSKTPMNCIGGLLLHYVLVFPDDYVRECHTPESRIAFLSECFSGITEVGIQLEQVMRFTFEAMYLLRAYYYGTSILKEKCVDDLLSASPADSKEANRGVGTGVTEPYISSGQMRWRTSGEKVEKEGRGTGCPNVALQQNKGNILKFRSYIPEEIMETSLDLLQHKWAMHFGERKAIPENHFEGLVQRAQKWRKEHEGTFCVQYVDQKYPSSAACPPYSFV